MSGGAVPPYAEHNASAAAGGSGATALGYGAVATAAAAPTPAGLPNASGNNSGSPDGGGAATLQPQHLAPSYPLNPNHQMGEIQSAMLASHQHQQQLQQPMQQQQQQQLQQPEQHHDAALPTQSHFPINPSATATPPNADYAPANNTSVVGGGPHAQPAATIFSPMDHQAAGAGCTPPAAPASTAPSSSSSPSSSSMCSLNNALGSATDDSAASHAAIGGGTGDYATGGGYTSAQLAASTAAMSDDEMSRSVSAAAAEAAAALSYSEAREKQRQEKKERHATKKLIKELAVCKAMLEGMEVSEHSCRRRTDGKETSGVLTVLCFFARYLCSYTRTRGRSCCRSTRSNSPPTRRSSKCQWICPPSRSAFTIWCKCSFTPVKQAPIQNSKSHIAHNLSL